MDIRTYAHGDRDSCLRVFDSNAPQYFLPAERGEFEAFLSQPDCPYFVMEHDGAIVGCGGYAIRTEQRLARLVWGMVRSDAHRMGLGRFLLLFRLREIGKVEGMEMVQMDTSQHSAGFFEKQGFRVTGVDKDRIGPGLDLVAMVKKLKVCA